MAANGYRGVRRAAEFLGVYQKMGCDIVGLQEIRRSGHQSALLQAGYVHVYVYVLILYCSDESVSPEATGKGKGREGKGREGKGREGKGRRAKVKLDWLF